jgi:hypothetical protein
MGTVVAELLLHKGCIAPVQLCCIYHYCVYPDKQVHDPLIAADSVTDLSFILHLANATLPYRYLPSAMRTVKAAVLASQTVSQFASINDEAVLAVIGAIVDACKGVKVNKVSFQWRKEFFEMSGN